MSNQLKRLKRIKIEFNYFNFYYIISYLKIKFNFKIE